MKKKSNTILNILIVLLLGIMAFSGYKLFEIQKAAKEIAEQYEEESQKADKILNIKIISACEIDEKQIQTIVEKYKTMYNVKSINYEKIIDESLLGGVKVMVGNKIYDGSIQTQLNKMF